REAIALSDIRGQTDVLVEIDRSANAQHVNLRMMVTYPRTNLRGLGRARHHAVIHLDVQRGFLEALAELRLQLFPVEFGRLAIETELALLGRQRAGEYRHPR